MRRMKDAALFNTPVRSRPAPMIITAISEITALPAKPSNNWSIGSRPVMPITTTTSSASTSARTHSRISIAIVKPTSPSTSIMSGVRVSSIARLLGLCQCIGWREGLMDAIIEEVPHSVTETHTPLLESRFDAPRRPFRIAAFSPAIAPRGRRSQHLAHVLRIVRPVGRQMQEPAEFDTAGEQLNECGLNQAALVVAFLVPGIREPDAHFVQRIRRNLVFEDLDGIVIPQPHVACAALRKRIHQPADAGAVDLDAEIVARGIVFACPGQRFAVAETDFKNARRASSEQRVEFASLPCVVH